MDFQQQLLALGQIIFIDLVLAGDNAIVVGLAASRVAPELRARVIAWGVAGAVVLRVLFSIVATQLLTIVGLTLAGGLLLLWVCWKMYREVVHSQPEPVMVDGVQQTDAVREMTFAAALTQIVIADVSMSLDNVLAVAGAAKGNLVILAIGLLIAVVMMAALANWIAGLLTKHRWITWIGLIVILYVAAEMIWTGAHQVGCQFVPESVCKAGAWQTLRALVPM
jgi:YjbE family integral membrane protein